MLSRQQKSKWKFLSIVIELVFDKWQSIIRRYKRLKFLRVQPVSFDRDSSYAPDQSRFEIIIIENRATIYKPDRISTYTCVQIHVN